MEESRGSSGIHHSSRREQQAAETRRLILTAARRLFSQQGYGATSIAQIAREAGVAIPTIYTSVGTKRDLLSSLNELAAADADVRQLVPRMLATQDPAELIALQTRLSRGLSEKAGDIIRAMETAATADPDLAGPYQAGTQRHRSGTRATIVRLANLGALRDAMTIDHAAALMDVMLTAGSWRTLTEFHGLSFDEAENLLTDSLTRLLIGQWPRHSDER